MAAPRRRFRPTPRSLPTLSTSPRSTRRPAAPSRAAVRGVALAVLLAAAGCGGSGGSAGAPAPGAESPPPPAVAPAPANPARRSAADAVHHERFQRLATEALRLMIAAAQRALPIGPLQQRIDAARLLAVSDVEAAADRLGEVVADLEALLEEGG